MKIAQIMLSRGFGGAERLFVDMCVALKGFDLDVHAICLKGSQAEAVLSEINTITVDTISLLGVWDPFASAKIGKILKLRGSNIVQAHLARAALLAGKACEQMGLPLVVTSHSYINSKYYRYVTRLLPPTQDQSAYYAKKGVSLDRQRVIPHFSMLEPIDKPMTGNSDDVRIISLGRFVKKKGYHVLLDAFSNTLKASNKNVELIIGGSGPEKASLEAQIQDLGISENVSLVGWVDNVQEFLRAGDIFVLPSLDEPFGIVVLEAMASGPAIISTTTKGPLEVLSEETAWLVEPGSVPALTKGLSIACDDSGARSEKSNNALETFKSNYSKDVVIPEFVDLFRSLVKEKTMPLEK